MRTDPTETGGLFVGRRPGTAPVRFRSLPRGGSAAASRRRPARERLLVAMGIVCLLFWGPIPILCLWVGSQVDYLSGSVGSGSWWPSSRSGRALGVLVMLARLDAAWILVRRAAGHDQRRGVAWTRLRDRGARRHASSWSGSSSFTVRARRSSRASPASSCRRLGLLDYYSQFEALSQEEVNRELREQAQRAQAAATGARRDARPLADHLAELPHPNIVNAITFVARSGLQHYPGAARAGAAQRALAPARGRHPRGSRSATGRRSCLAPPPRRCMRPGQELVTPWPSYPLFPVLASACRCSAVPGAGGPPSRAGAGSAGSRWRAHARRRDRQPQRSNGRAPGRRGAAAPAGGAAGEVAVLLDEALVEFATRPSPRRPLALL